MFLWNYIDHVLLTENSDIVDEFFDKLWELAHNEKTKNLYVTLNYFEFYNSPPYDFEDEQEKFKPVKKWIYNNCKNNVLCTTMGEDANINKESYEYGMICFYFESQEDMLLFKLTWM